jgi:DNA-binding NarL/FixJ family response regulator
MNQPYHAIDILMAEDHELYREGFKHMILQYPSINLISTANNGIELIQQVKKNQPQVIVTDICMPQMDGIQAARQISKEYPYIGIIALTMCEDDMVITEMIAAGVKGYILKIAEQREIIDAINTVSNGGTYYCRNTYYKIQKAIIRKRTEARFTPKEVIIIKMICASHCSQQIGDQLQLSKRTVESYRERIMEKMNVNKTVDLVMYAVKNKIYRFEVTEVSL